MPSVVVVLKLVRALVALALAAPLPVHAQPTEELASEDLDVEAEPQEPPLHPLHRIEYASLLGGRINPIGLEERFDLYYRLRLYRDPSPILREAALGIGFTPTISPAATRLGATVEFRPLSILLLSAGYYWVGWYGTFRQLQTWDSPHVDFSDSTMEDRSEAFAYATKGTEVQLRAQLLGKVGPIVVRNDLNVFNAFVETREGEHLFYDQRIDLLRSTSAFSLTNDTDVLYLSDFGFIGGARLNVSTHLYRDTDFRPGESTDDPNGPIVRVGPLLAYRFFDEPGAAFNQPTILAIANWYLMHRWRTGVDTNQALPYIALAFSFSGELWSSGRRQDPAAAP